MPYAYNAKHLSSFVHCYDFHCEYSSSSDSHYTRGYKQLLIRIGNTVTGILSNWLQPIIDLRLHKQYTLEHKFNTQGYPSSTNDILRVGTVTIIDRLSVYTHFSLRSLPLDNPRLPKKYIYSSPLTL